MPRIITESDADQKEWRGIRGIGGGDAAAILGISPWSTPYQLWLLKTYRAERKPWNAAMRRGAEREADARSEAEWEIGQDWLGPVNLVHCQPPGTQVLMAGGEIKTIETVSVGDAVVSYSNKSVGGYRYVGVRSGARLVSGAVRRPQGRRVTAVVKRPYQGVIYRINNASACTPEHRWPVRIGDTSRYCVYLMSRSNQCRIGMAKMFHGDKCRVTHRAVAEGADALWVLATYETKQEALIAEQVIAARYGLPQTTWRVTQNRLLSQTDIDNLYNQIGSNWYKGLACLQDFNRHPFVPLWSRHQADNGLYSKKLCFVAAANLLPDVMLVNRYDDSDYGVWEPVIVSRAGYVGEVYSLTVETHSLYVADGILTHNSDYPFLRAQLDDWSCDHSVILEFKVPNKKAHAEAALGIIPEYYLPQLDHELLVAGPEALKVGYVSWDEAGGCHIVWHYRDEERLAALLKEELAFWELIKNDEPPPLTIKDMIVRVDDEWNAAAAELKEWQRKYDEADKRLEAAKQKLITLADGKPSIGGGVKYHTWPSKGRVNYKKKSSELEQIMGEKLDDDDFRGEPFANHRFTVTD